MDEFQDTNPLQAALLDAWLGGRDDLAVVGDEDQTIYTFTGATSDYLIGFAARYPNARVVGLETNYRSTPEILGLANRVLAAGRTAAEEREPGTAPRPPKRLVASLPAGPAPEIGGFPTDEAELAGVTAAIRALARPARRMARWPSSSGPTPSCRPSRARWASPGSLSTSAASVLCPARGPPRGPRRGGARSGRERRAAGRTARGGFARELGVRRDAVPDGETAGERHGAVVTLLELADELVRTDPSADITAFLAEIARRTAVEAGGEAAGVELLTYHRAKGLEWDAVFLPALEEGTLRSARRRNRPSWPRSDGCSTSASPGRGATSGCPGRRRGSGHRGAKAGGAARASSMGSCRRAVPGRPAARRRRTRGAIARARRQGRPGRPIAASNALRAWRTARAKADAVAPFIVFHDSTIEAIAERRPRSIADLRRVPGVGPMKLDRYGEEIIGVVVRAG